MKQVGTVKGCRGWTGRAYVKAQASRASRRQIKQAIRNRDDTDGHAEIRVRVISGYCN